MEIPTDCPLPPERRRGPQPRQALLYENQVNHGIPNKRNSHKCVEEVAGKERTLRTDTTTIDEFAKYFHLQTNLRCMIVPVKLWIHQVSPTEYSYGLTFKLIKVLVKLPPNKDFKKPGRLSG